MHKAIDFDQERKMKLNLRQLSEGLKLPLSRLRYVVNQKLVPIRDWYTAEDEVGQPLKFNFVDCVFIACGFYLLEAGYKRDAVRFLLAKANKVMPEARNPLNVPMAAWALTSRNTEPAFVQFGDKARVRWKVGTMDSGWLRVDALRTRDDDYDPKIVVAIDFGLIRDQVRPLFPKDLIF